MHTHLIWLSVASTLSAHVQSLVGYVAGIAVSASYSSTSIAALNCDFLNECLCLGG